MPTSTAPKATSNSKSTSKSQATKTKAPTRAAQARSAVETAVDLPVGAALELGDRVVELVEPFTGRGRAQKQLKTYRTQLRRGAKRTERRGSTARRKAATEARKRVDRVAEQLPVLR